MNVRFPTLYRLGLLVLLAWLVLPLVAPLAAQPLTLAPESRLWIEGSSSVNHFVCEAGTFDGAGTAGPRATAQLTVHVQTFDCGKRAMNRDFRKALQADAHPTITYRLTEATLLPGTLGYEAYRLDLIGELTIAGTTRTIEMTVQGSAQPEGRFQLVGAYPLRMTDFNIDPPTALMGLIKVRDDIVVGFALVAEPVAAAPVAAPPLTTGAPRIAGPNHSWRTPFVP